MRFVSLILVVLVLPLSTAAQSNRLINTHDWPYELVDRLQKRGHLLQLNPSALPYTTGAVRSALGDVDTTALSSQERAWYRLLRRGLGPDAEDENRFQVGGVATAGARRSSSRRLNVLEPLGDGEPALPRVGLRGYAEWGPWIGQGGATFDLFYDVDPDGLDMARRLYGRSEEVYFGYNGRRLQAYLGRFDNQWALHDRIGGLLTDNPRSFDQIQIRFGNSTLSFRSILGVLDNMTADSTFTGLDRGRLGATRRYAFFHRLDWSPSASLKLSVMEAEIYHSPTAGIALRNLIPFHAIVLESANRPRNTDSNAMIGGSVWYQRGPITLYAQGMLDDILISRRAERKRSGEFYPAVYTVNGSVTWAGLTDALDLGAEVDVVSANAYRTDNRADEWSYGRRGLATNFSDYVRTQLHATWYATPALEFEPALTLYRKGEGDFRRLRVTYAPGRGGAIPSVLLGTVERTVRPSISLRYQPVSFRLFDPSSEARFTAWVDANVGYNFVQNSGHVEGATSDRFVGLFRIFGQITL